VNVRAQLPSIVMAVALAVAIALVELGEREPAGAMVELPMPGPLAGAVERLRSVPLVAIDDPDAAAVASGVVFGRTEHVRAQDEQAFLAAGLWHLLAASGQNVALVAGCCLVFARALGAGRLTGAALALVAIPGYVLVVGSGASIVRAGAMAELAIVAWLAGQLPHVRQLLLTAAAAICWLWPGAYRGLGMQLSFACVAALACWASPLTARLRELGVPGPIAGALAATGLCSAATAPILLLRTGAAPLTGIVANVVAVPLAAALLVGGLLASIAVAVLPSSIQDAVDGVLLWPAAQLAALLRELAQRATALPAAQTTSPLLAIGLPTAALLHGTPVGRGPRARRVLLCIAIGCVVVATLGGLARRVPGVEVVTGRMSPPAAGELRIGVLDIGQGDATLLATADEAILVDTGPPDGRVVERVHELGVDQLDGIVLPHDRLDHRGGFEAAYAAFHPRWVAMPTAAPGTWTRYREIAGTLVELCAGGRVRLGAVRIEVLNPPCDGHIPPHTSDLHNDGAMVLLVHHGEVDAVLPADAEAPVLLELGLPTLELLRVSHHGSRDGDLPELLARTTPQVAAISVGEHNDYGHPNPGVLAALRGAGVTTLRTDRDGTIAFESDGRVLRLVRG
jgi:competence protein ComEC